MNRWFRYQTRGCQNISRKNLVSVQKLHYKIPCYLEILKILIQVLRGGRVGGDSVPLSMWSFKGLDTSATSRINVKQISVSFYQCF